MKLLILHASAGGGHRRAAEALAEAAAEAGLSATVRDILDFVPPLYRKTYADGYLHLVRAAPELWGYLYTQSDRKAQRPVARRIRSVFNQLNAVSFYRFLAHEAPDAIVCTHFLPLELIAARGTQRMRGIPLFGVVTDFAAHALWYSRGVDAYYVATEASRRQLIRQGQAATRTALTGIPVMAAFAQRIPADVARRELGLRQGLPMVLILSGGFGVGPTLAMIRACVAEPPPCQLVAVAGRNPRLEAQARRLASAAQLPVTVFGFAHHIDRLMDAADIVASKPGGLTSAEVLAKGKPMLIVDPIPGQEQRNCDYLLESGCALRLPDAADAPWKLREALGVPSRLAGLSAAARRHGRPHAAADIIADILRRQQLRAPQHS